LQFQQRQLCRERFMGAASKPQFETAPVRHALRKAFEQQNGATQAPAGKPNYND
jgi:hypothetical protein